MDLSISFWTEIGAAGIDVWIIAVIVFCIPTLYLFTQRRRRLQRETRWQDMTPDTARRCPTCYFGPQRELRRLEATRHLVNVFRETAHQPESNNLNEICTLLDYFEAEIRKGN